MGVYNYLSNLWVSFFVFVFVLFFKLLHLISLNEWIDAVFRLAAVRADDFNEDQSCVPLRAPPPSNGRVLYRRNKTEEVT